MLFKGLPDLVKTASFVPGSISGVSLYTGFFFCDEPEFDDRDYRVLIDIAHTDFCRSKKMEGFVFLSTGLIYKVSSKYSMLELKEVLNKNGYSNFDSDIISRIGISIFSFEEVNNSVLGNATIGICFGNGLGQVILDKTESFTFKCSSPESSFSIPNSLIDYKLFIRFMLYGTAICTDDELNLLSNYTSFAVPRSLFSDEDKRSLLSDSFDM